MYNERISQLFGNQVGPTWGATRIVTSDGCCIQAIGKGQSLRGVKHLSHRPDLIIADDIEDEDAVRTPEAREAMLQWWTSVVQPAMAIEGHIRMLATPLRDGREEDEKSLPLRLMGKTGWEHLTIPIKHIDPNGEWVASWPERYPLDWIARKEEELTSLGQAPMFSREYMCEALSEQARVSSEFMPDHTPYRSHGFMPVKAAFDPARTSRSTSDYTGWAVRQARLYRDAAARLPGKMRRVRR